MGFMEDRVIEPSEIIVENGRAKRQENITHANPWLRFLGRFFDYSWFFLILWGIRKFAHGQFPFGKYEHLVPFEYFVWIPIEALMLASWGTTPGKFLLGTKLKFQGRGRKLDFTGALRRSFAVWFRGLGMGIPVLNVFCMMVAYNRLRMTQMTSWDREERIVVTHYPIGRWRIGVAAALAIFGLLFYYGDRKANLKLQSYAVNKTQNAVSL